MKIAKPFVCITFVALLIPSTIFAKVYKCTSSGRVSYQSEPCEEIKTNTTEQNTVFKFDGWKAGMTISQMKRLARKRQLNMSPGTSTILSSYNEKILNSRPEQRNYAYKTNLMGKLTGVVLYFTKTTKQLYKVKATFYVVQTKQEERKYFYESLYSQLSEKYGKAKLVTKNSSSISGAIVNLVLSDLANSKLQSWLKDADNSITLSYKEDYFTMTSYELNYINKPLTEKNKHEVTNSLQLKTKESLQRDGSRL